MPLNFQQIYSRVHAIGREAKDKRETADRQRERAWKLLAAHSANLVLLAGKVERLARDQDPNLRCASPHTEELTTRRPVRSDPEATTLIAVDGSQIVPDRHAALQYGLINIGAVSMRVNAAEAPRVFTESELLYEDELRNKDGSLLDEGGIALQRDARERARLLELAQQAEAPVVTLTDGPVELWGAKDPANAGNYQNFLSKYLDDLDRFNDLGVALGGYVDKPAADLVVRLLEVAIAADEDEKKLREYHPLAGASDRWLFGRLLQPGERSAVFRLQSGSRSRYTGARAIHFFYLNAGRAGRAAVARVEVPQWVADDPRKLDMLHAALIQQSRLLGAKPYPYILHRAHETAKVTFDEKGQVELLLALELRKAGVEMEEASNKKSAKDLPGRKR